MTYSSLSLIKTHSCYVATNKRGCPYCLLDNPSVNKLFDNSHYAGFVPFSRGIIITLCKSQLLVIEPTMPQPSMLGLGATAAASCLMVTSPERSLYDMTIVVVRASFRAFAATLYAISAPTVLIVTHASAASAFSGVRSVAFVSS